MSKQVRCTPTSSLGELLDHLCIRCMEIPTPHIISIIWPPLTYDCPHCTSRKQGFGSGLASPLEPVQPRTETLGGIRPGSCSQGASRPRETLGPVRLRVYVPVPYKNRDQFPRSLAHNHCPRFVVRTGTKGSPLEPVPTTNRDQVFGYISLAGEQSTHLLVLCFFVECKGRALWCSSSPPMHMMCSMKCPGHTT